MSFCVYMLHCFGGTYYVGQTDDLDTRIAQHQGGLLGGYTATRLPVKLVWAEYYATRHEARAMELRIKGWSRAKKMALIRGDWDALSALSKGKNSPSTSSGKREI
jgi:predicted GIY-YIG superfamily endonuclease